MTSGARRRSWSCSVGVAVFALFCSTLGCSVVSRTVAPIDDYADYKRLRVAEGRLVRLGYAWHYLEQHPDGEFRQQVNPWFESQDASFIEAAWNDPRRLSAYLEHVPDGPRSSLVQARLEALQKHQKEHAARERAVIDSARQTQLSFAQAKVERAEFIAAYRDWLVALLQIDSWGKRTSALPSEFLHRFREQPPAAVCDDAKCTKPLDMGFSVPAQSGLVGRAVRLSIVLELSDGNVVSARLEGPELFTRLGEALLVRAADDAVPRARAEALGATVDFSDMTAEPLLPASDCEHPAVSPVVMIRRCHGLEVVWRAAVSRDGLDQILIHPVAGDTAVPAPSPAAPGDSGPSKPGASPSVPDGSKPNEPASGSDAKP